MLVVTYDESKSIVILEPDGNLTDDNFMLACNIVDTHIELKNSIIGIIVITKEFTNWDSFADLLQHLVFVRDYHRKIKHIALVSDTTVVGFADRMIRHFSQAEVCSFPYNNFEHARKWMLNRDDV